MTANQFAEANKFSENDKTVVKKMYGNQTKSFEAWSDLLSSDFVFKKQVKIEPVEVEVVKTVETKKLKK